MNIEIRGQKVRRIDSVPVVSDSHNYLTCNFTFTEEWKPLAKVALFGLNGVQHEVPIEDNKCIVPYQVIRPSCFTLSVYGYDTEKIITTNMVDIFVKRSGLSDIGYNIFGAVTGTARVGLARVGQR